MSNNRGYVHKSGVPAKLLQGLLGLGLGFINTLVMKVICTEERQD